MAVQLRENRSNELKKPIYDEQRRCLSQHTKFCHLNIQLRVLSPQFCGFVNVDPVVSCFVTVALTALRPRPQAQVSQDIMDMDGGRRESMLAEADMASVFCQILKEQHEGLDLRRASQQGEEKHIAASTDFVKNIITGENHM